MFNNLPSSSLNPFNLAFRQGGAANKWGLWLHIGGNDLLVNPEALADTLVSCGDFPYIFIPESPGEEWDDAPLPFRNLSIRDVPWLAASYLWRLESNDGSSLLLSFGLREYIMATYKGLRDIYRFCVLGLLAQETAYETETDPEFDLWLARCLAGARRKISLAVEQFLRAGIEEDWTELDLHLSLQPFHAAVDPVGQVTIQIGCREERLSLWETPPEEFRHNLEHLLFHRRTSFSWKESSDFTRTLELSRETVSLLPDEEPVLMVYEEIPDGIVGFCRERDVVLALARVFQDYYPDDSIGDPLENRIRTLQEEGVF